MSSLFFLITFGWAFGRCSRDAFFIKAAGPEQLPYMYFITAGLIVATSYFYSRIVDTMARHRFLILQLLFSGGVIIVVWMAIPLKYIFLPYALFSLSETISSLLFMHFGIFANSVFNLREGKRIFPLIGGVGLIGTVLGSALAHPVVAWIGTVNLLLVWLATLVLSIPIVLRAHQSAKESGVLAQHSATAKDESEEVGFFQRFSDVWRVPLIRTLTYLSIPMWLVSYFVDFQFFMAINEVFGEQDQLTGFLGIFNSITFLSGFMLQLFVTGRLLRKFGVGNTILAHPISLTFGALGLAIRSFLPVIPSPRLSSFRALSGVFAKFSDNAIYFSTSESASQLLSNAFPKEKRGRSRAFISGTVEPICIALAGGMLIILGITRTPIYLISLTTVGLGFLWLLLALRVKTDYMRALVENLSSRHIDLRTSAIMQLTEMKDARATPVLLEAVRSSPGDEVAALALELLAEIGDDSVVDALCEMLPKVHPNVKIATLSVLSELGMDKAVPAIRPLLEDTRLNVRAAAVKAIGMLGNKGVFHHLLVPFLDDPTLDVRSEMMIALIRGNTGGDIEARIISEIKEMANDAEPSVQAKAAYIIGEARLKQLLTGLLSLAASDDKLVQSESIRALGKMGDEQVIPPLVKFLGMDRLMHHALEAIVNLGEMAFRPLHNELASDEHDEGIQMQIIRCLGHLGYPDSVPVLANRIEPSFSTRLRVAAIDALIRIQEKAAEESKGHWSPIIQKNSPEELRPKISQFLVEITQQIQKEQDAIHGLGELTSEKATLLLTDALNRASQHGEKIAIKCLQLLTDAKTIRTAAVNLQSSTPRTRAEAIEVLEGSCDEARDLARVLEAKYLPTRVHRPTPGPAALFHSLLTKEQPLWIRVCAVYTVGELRLTACVSELLSLQHEPDIFLRRNVFLALQKIGTTTGNGRLTLEAIEKKEVAKMALNMERIMFLRSVPLFSDVDGSDLQWISEIMKEKTYPTGETIFHENDEGDALYIIMKGSVRVVKGREKQVMLAILEVGDCFGEMGIFGEPRSASIEVQKEATLLIIKRDDFQRLILARPHISFSLFKTLSSRLRETNAKLLELAG